MAASDAILINGLKQVWGDAYRAGINRRRRLRCRIASLQQSKRRRVRKKWAKVQLPPTDEERLRLAMESTEYHYTSLVPSFEYWERKP